MPRLSVPAQRARPAVPLLVGLVTQAVTTYVVLILAGRSLGPAGFAALSSLYFLLTSVATGLFTPLEQEVTRRRGTEWARGEYEATLRRRALIHGLAAAAVAAAGALVLWPVTLRILGDEPWLVASFCLALPGYACWFATRGELAGRGRLRRYGAQLVVDGTSRLVGAVALVLAGLTTPAWFGLLFAVSPWLALLVPSPSRPRSPTLRDAGSLPLLRPLALLVVSALAAQLLINAGPLVVSLLASDSERARAGVYLAVLVVVRVPVFLFTAMQPGLLRSLSAQAGAGHLREFRHLIATVLAALAGVTVVGAVVATAIAPPLVSWLFDFDQTLDRWICLLLTLSVGLFLLAVVCGQGLLALGHHIWVTTGWLVGVLGLAAGAAVGQAVVTRATNGLLAGAVVATACLGLLLRRELTR